MRTSKRIMFMNIILVVSIIISAGLVAFLIFSASQIRISVKSPSVAFKENKFSLTIPLVFQNPGPKSIDNMYLKAVVRHANGEILGLGETGPISIPAGARDYVVEHKLSMDLNKLSEETIRSLMFNDQDLEVRISLGAGFEPFITISSTALFKLAWGAPLANLKVEVKDFKIMNATHLKIIPLIYFENHSPYFDLVGKVKILVFDEEGNLIGSGEFSVEANRGSVFQTSFSLLASPRFKNFTELVFKDITLRYKVKAIIKAYGFTVPGLSWPLNIEWRAPIKNLKIGEVRLYPHNSTAAKFSVPIKFVNTSPYVDLLTNLTINVIDLKTRNIIGRGMARIEAPRKSGFDGSADGLLRFDNMRELLFHDKTFKYLLEIRGRVLNQEFKLSRKVDVEWGAPLFNFTLSKPEFIKANSTHISMGSSIYFENHSPYLDIDTPLLISIYNKTSGKVLSSETLKVVAPRASSYKEDIIIHIPISNIDFKGLLFNNTIIDLDIMVKGVYSSVAFNIQRDYKLIWKAPISNLTIDLTEAVSLNATHSKLALSLSFNNTSEFLNLRGRLMIKILDLDRNLLSKTRGVEFNINPGSSFAEKFYTIIQGKLPDKIIIRLEFVIEQGSYSIEVVEGLEQG